MKLPFSVNLAVAPHTSTQQRTTSAAKLPQAQASKMSEALNAMLPVVPGGRYVVVRPVCRNVFLAVDRRAKSEVVLKRVFRPSAPSEACRGLAEYLAGKQMDHANIIRTLDW